jgi:ribosomal protein S18 acetylase RimI-like enzyme
VIRQLTSNDLDACVALYVETFNAPPWNESWGRDDARRRLGDFLATPRSLGLGLYEDGENLLGFALGHEERSGPEDHFLLQEMCVRAAQQRHGHGSKLMTSLTQTLAHVRHWYLLTARESSASAFYEKHGFRPAGRLGVYVRP